MLFSKKVIRPTVNKSIPDLNYDIIKNEDVSNGAKSEKISSQRSFRVDNVNSYEDFNIKKPYLGHSFSSESILDKFMNQNFNRNHSTSMSKILKPISKKPLENIKN